MCLQRLPNLLYGLVTGPRLIFTADYTLAVGYATTPTKGHAQQNTLIPVNMRRCPNVGFLLYVDNKMIGESEILVKLIS